MTCELYIMTSLLYYLWRCCKNQGGFHELRHPESSISRPALLSGERGRPDRGAALPVTNHLRVLRAERDWSQAELAARLGVSRQTVNAIETDRYSATLPLAFKIAQLFGKLIEDVFEPENGRGK